MRGNARWLLGACSLALAVPCGALAAPFDDPPVPGAVSASPSPEQSSHEHHHRTWFARRHCVECQRAYVKAHDGVDVPPPPALDGEAAVHTHMAGVQAETCPVCQGATVVQGSAMSAPGYAVVGGSAVVAGAGAPGYAVVGGEMVAGSEPAPIGVSSAGRNPMADPRMAAMGPRGAAGSLDPAVVPTSVPPGQIALMGPPSNRPHIIRHLLGLDALGKLHRDAEAKERQKHASIAYDQPKERVTELPKSMVYGNGDK
jgi:hypothetical protein